MQRCVHSSGLSDAGSCGNGRKDSITTWPRRHATTGAEREFRSERSSPVCQEILPVKPATPRMARSGGVSVMHHRTTVHRADLIEGIVNGRLGDRTVALQELKERSGLIIDDRGKYSLILSDFLIPHREARRFRLGFVFPSRPLRRAGGCDISLSLSPAWRH